MMRAMGQSQVLETNNMFISIYFITKGDFGDYGGDDYGGFDDGGGFDGGDRWTSQLILFFKLFFSKHKLFDIPAISGDMDFGGDF